MELSSLTSGPSGNARQPVRCSTTIHPNSTCKATQIHLGRVMPRRLVFFHSGSLQLRGGVQADHG
eukprot:12333023-Alexandrium_andersonii.AAC.1